MTAGLPPLSVAVLAAAYRRRRGPASPVEVIELLLERIAERDPAIRSLATVTPKLARRAASRARERLAAGDPSPLVGVPIAVKDLIDVRGTPTTAGSRVLAGNVARRDASLVAALRRAGAVVIGKANTHEFAYGGTTEPTRNPWHLGSMVGGSSGGSAAALAADMCAAAIGTDTAGSVRIPANLCGVFGLKPTNGSVSSAGIVPLAPSLDVPGPLGHTVEDLALVLDGMRGGGAVRRAFAAHRRRLRRALRRGGPRIGVLRGTGPTTPGAAAAFDAAVVACRTVGAATRDVELPGFGASLEANFTVLGVEAALVHRRWADQRHLYTDYVRERLEQAAATTALAYLDALGAAAPLRAAVDALLADVDAVLLPGVPFAAPPAGASEVRVGKRTELRDIGLCRNMAFANVTGHPVLAVPAGFDRSLPVGVQLVGRRGGDVALLAVGAEMAERLSVPTRAPVPAQPPAVAPS